MAETFTLESIQAGVARAQASTQALLQRIQTEGVQNAAGQTIIQPGTQAQVNGVFTGGNVSPLTPVNTNVPTTEIAIPTIPTPKSTEINDAYFRSLTEELVTSRKAYEDLLQKNLDDLAVREKAAQAKIDEFSKKQEDLIKGDVQNILQPFRETLENAERERLFINENFQANQALINELDSLLTEGNTLIEQQRNVTGLAAIRDPRIAKTMSDVAARVGVIEAVINARNGQIARAQTMIGRSIAASTADKNDQLTYYNALLDFYGGRKGDEQKKLVNISADQKGFVEAQISLLETDLSTAQANAEAIKEAMTDPDTALFYAEAGITMNDTAAQRARKIAEHTYTLEVIERSNKKAEDGYRYLAPGQVAPQGSEVIPDTDSRGVTKNYWREKKGVSGTDSANKVRKFLADNADKTREENKAELLRLNAEGVIDMSISEINAELDRAGSKSMEDRDFIDEEYIRSIFTADELDDVAKRAGFTKGGIFGAFKAGDVDAYIADLLIKIEFNRSIGISDVDSLKQLGI